MKQFWRSQSDLIHFKLMVIYLILANKMPVRTNNWDVETNRNKLEKRRNHFT